MATQGGHVERQKARTRKPPFRMPNFALCCGIDSPSVGLVVRLSLILYNARLVAHDLIIIIIIITALQLLAPEFGI
jgi:hypothetical protein